MGLVTAAISSIGFVALTTILISLVVAAIKESRADWLAIGLAIPIAIAAGLSIFYFFRQLLMLTGIGASNLEISGYPLLPGNSYQAFLSQTSQVRLQRLDVHLVCQEEATFNQGTDVRTERLAVWNQRMFRDRGIIGRAKKPFETEFQLQISPDAMHSFKSPNNRVQWSIVVTAKAKNWPQLERVFPVIVHPRVQETTVR